MYCPSFAELRQRFCPVACAIAALVVTFLCLPQSAAAHAAAGSSRPLVVVTQLTAPSGDPVADKLSSTITGSVGLVMRMTGSLRVERADFLTPTLSFRHALEYYRKVDAGGAVYGLVKPATGGGYTVDLTVWNGEHPGAKPVTVHTTITNLLSSFAIADRLSLEVASTVVGRKLEEGRLVVEGLSGLPHYSVYADGHLLARNRSSLQVLTGLHEIVVAKPGALGDVPVQFFRVNIQTGKTATVKVSKAVSEAALSSPAATRTAPNSKTATSRGGTAAEGLAISSGNLNLRYKDSSGIFGHPSLTYGNRTYTLATKGEYTWAAALLSNLPGVTSSIRSKLAEVERLLNQAQRRRTSLSVLSGIGLGGIGAAAYGLIQSSSTALNVGLMVGLASIAAVIPTRMLESDSMGQINADFASAVKEYEALPASVKSPQATQPYFDFQTDFSQIQGADNWYFGYSGTGPHARFQLMPDWHPESGSPTWWADYATSWAQINAYGLAPASTKTSSSTGPADSVVRFVVPADGVYAVTVTFNRSSGKGTPGVTLDLRKDGSPVWSRTMSRSDTYPHVEQRTLTCRRGDTLDFVASAYDLEGYDFVNMEATISRER